MDLWRQLEFCWIEETNDREILGFLSFVKAVALKHHDNTESFLLPTSAWNVQLLDPSSTFSFPLLLEVA